MKLLIFSDLHLDKAFIGLGTAAKTRRQALRDTLVRIVEMARIQKVDAVICAGNLYEHDRVMPSTPEFLRDVFDKLQPIAIYIAPGDSDWYSDSSLYRRVKWSPNVHVFSATQPEPVQLSEDVTLWGAAHHARQEGAPSLEDFDGGTANGVHLAVFHLDDSDVAITASGTRAYAPALVRRMKQRRFGALFLGHRWPVDAESSVSPGAPDPLDFEDSGQGTVVLIEIAGGGVVHRERHRVALSSVHDLELDVTGCSTPDEITDRIHGAVNELAGCVRLSLFGDLDPAVQWPSEALVFPHLDVLLISRERVRLLYDWDSLARQETVAGQFVRDVSASSEISAAQRTGVLVAGVRALEGRDDLEA